MYNSPLNTFYESQQNIWILFLIIVSILHIWCQRVLFIIIIFAITISVQLSAYFIQKMVTIWFHWFYYNLNPKRIWSKSNEVFLAQCEDFTFASIAVCGKSDKMWELGREALAYIIKIYVLLLKSPCLSVRW